MKMVRDASSSLLYGDSNTTSNSSTFEKKLKLFGFEISETTQQRQQQQSLSPTMICDETINHHEKMLLNDGEESTNSSNTVSSGGGRADHHHNNHKNDRTSSVISNIEVEGDQKRYECQYCFKEFANSQALGGHQNAHKKERLKKKRLQLQAKKASINFYLHQQPYYSHYQNCQNILNSKSASGTQQWYFDRSYNNNNNNYNTVVPVDDDHQYASIYEGSQISFGPFEQDQDRHHQMPAAAFQQQQFTLTHTNTSNSNATSRCNSEDTPSRHVIIKPSPLPVSKQSCKSLDLQLGLC